MPLSSGDCWSQCERFNNAEDSARHCKFDLGKDRRVLECALVGAPPFRNFLPQTSHRSIVGVMTSSEQCAHSVSTREHVPEVAYKDRRTYPLYSSQVSRGVCDE